MRTHIDRLRHTILLEGFALVIVTPLAAWILGKELSQVGAVTLFCSGAAMAYNYSFNLVFDHMLRRLGRPVNLRPPRMRALHAMLFEISFLCITVPAIAWWLDMMLWEALLADLGFALFFLVYVYIFNWTYDRILPMPVASEESIVT